MARRRPPRRFQHQRRPRRHFTSLRLSALNLHSQRFTRFALALTMLPRRRPRHWRQRSRRRRRIRRRQGQSSRPRELRRCRRCLRSRPKILQHLFRAHCLEVLPLLHWSACRRMSSYRHWHVAAQAFSSVAPWDRPFRRRRRWHPRL